MLKGLNEIVLVKFLGRMPDIYLETLGKWELLLSAISHTESYYY